MSFYCVKKVSKKPSKSLNRKNARTKEKQYYYVYEAHAYRAKRTQKVKHKILHSAGQLFEPKHIKEVYFSVFDVMSLDKDAILKFVIRQNLIAYGFTEVGMDCFENGNAYANLQKLEVRNKSSKKRIAVKINEGFLCNHTLKTLFSFDLTSRDELPELARLVRNIGLLPLTPNSVEENDKEKDYNLKQVEGLINAMSKVMGDEPNSEEQKLNFLVERYRTFFAVLIKKYPNFNEKTVEPKKEDDVMSFDDFRKKHGW
ncbi:MAG: hypothetical protein V1859_02550 [archaeon]